MKIRTGFVSNSSSSSFLVVLQNYWDPNELKILTEEQIKVLKDWQFTFQDYNATKMVDCNQDEVIYALIEKKIRFTAYCHYGHYSVYYNPAESNKVYFIQNFGNQITTYGIETLKEMKLDKAVDIMPDSEYLRKNKEYKSQPPSVMEGDYEKSINKEEYKQ